MTRPAPILAILLASAVATSAAAQTAAQKARIARDLCRDFTLEKAEEQGHALEADAVEIVVDPGAGLGDANQIPTRIVVETPTLRAFGRCVVATTVGLSGYVRRAKLDFYPAE